VGVGFIADSGKGGPGSLLDRAGRASSHAVHSSVAAATVVVRLEERADGGNCWQVRQALRWRRTELVGRVDE